MKGYVMAMDLLPERLRRAAAALSRKEQEQITEFRLRCGRRPTVLMPTGEREFAAENVQPGELYRLLEICSGASPYAAAESLRTGYITADGGVRVGFCGEIVCDGERIKTVKGLSSAAIRIPREVFGCGRELCTDTFVSTLLLSPPGGGKTTLLRDMIRCLSDDGYRVALCDERGEVAAMADGVSGFDLGARTDVISGGKKSETAMMLLRSMTPDIVAMDEITAPADLDACRQLSHCGIELLATAHAAGVDELEKRPLYRELLGCGLFKRAVIIRCRGTERHYEEESLC